MAALSSLVGQPLSGSPRVNFGQFRKPCFHNWRGITVSVPPTCTLAPASPLSGSRRFNFGQFRKPCFHNWRGITVSVPPTCTLATASGNNAREQPTDHSINSLSDHDPEVVDVPQERDFTGTAYVPIYVKLPLGIINMECEIVDADGLLHQLKVLKSANVDGVMVQCWWGIVEAHIPREYNWTGYKRLFEIVRDLNLKLKVGLSFHECGGNIGDDVHIPLPRWVTEVGHKNPDIYFTDKDLRRNHECLTWGIDKEPVLRGRTALEVYFGIMKRFRSEFNEFFENGVISEIEVGLGPSGALRYPSHPAKFGWKYPGIGEFQCYDKYLAKRLEKAAETRGNILCGEGPWNAGSYNSEPQETKFFRDRGDYERSYGMFFLNWYSQVLIDHGDRVLRLANLAFRGTRIAAKLSGIYWWFGTMSHAAELTAGYYNIDGRSGYSAIASMLKKREAALNFTCFELCKFDEQNDFPEASVDPESLVWQVLVNAWAAKVPFAGENTRSCYHREGYNKILENAKPLDDPYGDAHISAFTYLGLSQDLLEKQNLMEFERFIQKMHGEFLPPIK